MDADRSNANRTETDDRDAENVMPAPFTTTLGPDVDPDTGLPRGSHPNDDSPLDPGEPFDPFEKRGAKHVVHTDPPPVSD